MAGSYPAVIKQFLQFCLVPVYPVGGRCAVLQPSSTYGALWVLFGSEVENRPDEYAASQQEAGSLQPSHRASR